MPALLHARVNGAGPTGALAALALAAAGWRVSLRDPLGREALLGRSRAYAFTHSSRRLLERLDLWDVLAPHLTPFRRLRLEDRGARRRVTFTTADLGGVMAADSTAAVGWIGLHTPLMGVLLERLEAHPAVFLHLGVQPAGTEERGTDGGGTGGSGTDGVAVDPAGDGPADLVVAADGPFSATRSAQGIGQAGWAYGQSCLTVQVELRGCPEDEAWELLRPEGPFAVLPLGGRRFQVVWSAPPWRCRQLEGLPDAAFLDALAGALPDALQPDVLLDEPRAFPVGLRLARRFHRGRTVLVGDSAHGCHPVGGQGLNLGWRDVAMLHRLAERAARGALSSQRLAAAYGRRRWPDVLLTLLATDLLVRTFSNRHRLLLPPRRLALALLEHSPLLRRWLLGVMTRGGCGAPRRPPA